MPRILTLFLILHWATVFSLLAAACIFEGGGADSLRFFGIDLLFEGLDHPLALAVQALASFGFTICAVLFWWASATLVLSLRAEISQGGEVLRVAFAGAALLMTLILVVGAAAGVDGVFAIVATHSAALIASYVAIESERAALPFDDQPSGEEFKLAARVRALDASQVASLHRFVPQAVTFRRFDR